MGRLDGPRREAGRQHIGIWRERFIGANYLTVLHLATLDQTE